MAQKYNILLKLTEFEFTEQNLFSKYSVISEIYFYI